MDATPRLRLIADADVLIDIADANEAVLALIVQHVAPVIVPTPVLAEIDTLDEFKCAALGLEVVEPTLDQLREAARPHAALSFADKVCLIVARDGGATCWTNDGPLGDECDANGVPRMRGLRPILALVERGLLPLVAAIGTVELISANNTYITPAIVEEFRRLAKRGRPRASWRSLIVTGGSSPGFGEGQTPSARRDTLWILFLASHASL